jgi:hypothetical protein
MGPKSKVNQLDLSQGDEVRLLVRPAKVNGQPAMVADEIWANGKHVDIAERNQVSGFSNDSRDSGYQISENRSRGGSQNSSSSN